MGRVGERPARPLQQSHLPKAGHASTTKNEMIEELNVESLRYQAETARELDIAFAGPAIPAWMVVGEYDSSTA